VGHDLAPLRSELWALAALLAVAGSAVVALSVAGGWFVAAGALEPINRISRTARKMNDGDLAARIPIDRVETELGQVARALNGAFDRLQASLDRQRRLTADVSHELRTPLATLSTEAQWALGRDRSIEEYRESLRVSLRAATRMQAIVERLLSLARSEVASEPPPHAPVALDDIVKQAVTNLSPLAERRRIHVTVDAPAFTVKGDPDRLLEAMTNVIANGIAYNTAGGRVTVTLQARGGQVETSVADTGIGIAPQDLPLVFDPFFRADQARSRDAGGAGLGLAVTRAIVERHSGHITCRSALGRGTEFLISLPMEERGRAPTHGQDDASIHASAASTTRS
jgi:signal transduction histidine kinase